MFYMFVFKDFFEKLKTTDLYILSFREIQDMVKKVEDFELHLWDWVDMFQDLQDGKETEKPKYIAKFLQNRGLQAIDPNAYTREWCTFWLEEIYNFTYVEFYKYANPVFSLYFEKKEERKRERRWKRYEKNRKNYL